MVRTDRVWRTEIGDYDQVIALTQHMINEGIDNLYLKLQRDNTLTKPSNFASSERDYLFKVVFGPPSIIIEADAGNTSSVKYRMHIKSGICSITKHFEPPSDDEPRPRTWVNEYSMEDWYCEVPVNVGFTQLKEGEARYEAIKSKMKPGDHSIYQLLVDLTTAAWSNGKFEFGNWTDKDWTIGPDGSKSRPENFRLGEPKDWSKEPQRVQDAFAVMVGIINRDLVNKGLLTLGYAASTGEPSKKATFEVNQVRYQTYPWTNPSDKSVPRPGLDGLGRLHYLCYLETVGLHAPPPVTAKGALLDTSKGNWTDGTNPNNEPPNKFGNFVLSRKNFVEQYFLPRLSRLNRMMQLNIESTKAVADARFLTWYASIYYKIGVGTNWLSDVDEHVFAFKAGNFNMNDRYDGDTKDFLRDLTQIDEGAQIWTYVDEELHQKNDYSHNGSVEVWTYGQTITWARVVIVPGTNQIKLRGKSWTKLDYKVDPSIVARNWYGGFISKAEWSITFTLQEVSDGGIQIDITYEKPSVSFPWNPGHPDNLPEAEKTIREGYKVAGTNFEWCVNELRNSLQGQERFTLPSEGTYFFKNPMFDHNANLICELPFNGNPSSSVVNEGAPVRAQVSRGVFKPMPESSSDSRESKDEK